MRGPEGCSWAAVTQLSRAEGNLLIYDIAYRESWGGTSATADVHEWVSEAVVGVGGPGDRPGALRRISWQQRDCTPVFEFLLCNTRGGLLDLLM